MRISILRPLLLSGLLALALLAVPSLPAAPVTGHPRLLFRAADLPALRARIDPETNDAWAAFKTQIVDKAVEAYHCGSTSEYRFVYYDANDHSKGGENRWVRTSFTEPDGTVHKETDGPALWEQTDWWNNDAHPAVPEDDVGQDSGNVRLYSEQYAMVFALMARLYDDGTLANQTKRDEFLAMAKDCLFHVIDPAQLGTDPTNTLAFRQSGFATNDRSFSQEAFPITADLIYEHLTPLELAKIRKAFLVWTEQCNAHYYFAPYRVNGQHLPANSPALLRLEDPVEAVRHNEIRLALNNHWANHLRQMGLYGLALDPQDDRPASQVPEAVGLVDDSAPAGSVTSQIVAANGVWTPVDYGALRDATGVWLYLTDYAYRHDGAGGLSVEGIEYASNGLGPVGLLMNALHTAGQDDPAVWGPQVSLQNHPQWSRAVSAYLAMLPPAPRTPADPNYAYLAPIFQPPAYGDLETYTMVNDQFIKFLAPMALYDARVNGTTAATVQAVRYIQRHLTKGGPAKFADRIGETRSEKRFRDAINYFLLFDPTAPAPADPRPGLQPLNFYAAHTVAGREMGTLLARSGQAATDTMFHFRADWNRINHQHGDALSFGLWKNGLWLTKPMTGYGTLQACSDYKNTLGLQNGVPLAGQTPVGEDIEAVHGSQWVYSPIGDPAMLARSLTDEFVYFTADATPLYNHNSYANLREIEHASRSILWLKPNSVVVYDRARSKQGGYAKKFWLNLPEAAPIDGGTATVTGHVVHATAREGAAAKAELFVTALLPLNATPQLTQISTGQPSGGEDMQSRMFTEAPLAPRDARFLHVVQGTDAGVATPDATQLIQSTSGTAYDGTVVGPRAILFKRDIDAIVTGFSYTVPASVTQHYLTGLEPFAGYVVNTASGNGETVVTLTADASSSLHADSGGVLTLGVNTLPSVTITAGASSVLESSGAPVTFTVSRSGDVSQALVVALGLDPATSSAGAADVIGLPAQAVIPAGSVSAAFDIAPVADGVAEGAETLVLRLTAGAGYQIDAAGASAAVVISETAPLTGHVQFASTSFTVAENVAAGVGPLTVNRTGGTEGALSVNYTITGGTAIVGTDYNTISGSLTWADGDSLPKNIAIPLLDDAVPDGTKTVVVALVSPSVVGGLGTPAASTLTITDDETPGGGAGGGNGGGGNPVPDVPGVGTLQFTTVNTTVAENAGFATLAVSRTAGATGVVSVGYYTLNYSATSGADFTYTGGTLTWGDGDTADKFISIPILDDATPEAAKYFKVTLQSPGNGGVLGANTEATVTIADDDGAAPPPDGGGNGGGNGGGGAQPGNPGALEFAVASVTVAENAGSATLTVNRTGGTDGAVSVNYYTLAGSAVAGSEYGYTSGTLHWLAGDAAPKTISIPILDDTTEEPTKSFQLTLDAPAGGATLGAAALATITITDDEVVYHVGPGQSLAALAEVPWSTLPAGATVRLHWRAEPYTEKVLLSTRGTVEQPITFEGVPGPNGELPILDGTGAVAAPNIGYAPWYGDVMERSLIAVARNATAPAAFKPGHIVIAKLELRMSGPKTPMPAYVKPDGTMASYYANAGAVFLYGAEHVTIRDCVIHDTPNGIVAVSGSGEDTLTRDVTVEHCWLYDAGKGGAYNGANVLGETIGLVVQFSRLDRGLNGAAASNLLDRSAGTVVRYNWIEGGGKLVELLEPLAAPALIVADPAFATSHVYGNVLRNGAGDYGTDGSTLIGYGGGWSNPANFRSGTLHFHHNTVVVDSQRWSTTLFNLALAPAQVVAHNNVVHRVKSGAGPFNLVNSGRMIALGRNWITTGCSVGGIAAGGTGQVLTGAEPGFVDLAGENYVPAAGSPLLDVAMALPAGAHPVDFEYAPEATGVPRPVGGAAPDLGAFERPGN